MNEQHTIATIKAAAIDIIDSMRGLSLARRITLLASIVPLIVTHSLKDDTKP